MGGSLAGLVGSSVGWLKSCLGSIATGGGGGGDGDDGGGVGVGIGSGSVAETAARAIGSAVVATGFGGIEVAPGRVGAAAGLDDGSFRRRLSSLDVDSPELVDDGLGLGPALPKRGGTVAAVTAVTAVVRCHGAGARYTAGDCCRCIAGGGGSDSGGGKG